MGPCDRVRRWNYLNNVDIYNFKSRMKAFITAISLGWGVQSWTLAAMVALGELPPIDFAVHSDTTWERSTTYQFAETWTPWLAERGVRVVTVSNPEKSSLSNEYGGVHIPAYTITDNGNGQLRRQCTQDWKITPMRRYIATKIKSNKTPGAVEQWLGITIDEYHRAKDSDVQYITNRFPLLEMGYSRSDCIAWLKAHSLPVPGKSACTFCPYHNRLAWEQMKREGGHDWEQAVDVDARIRDKRPPYPLFVHPARVPLPEAVKIAEDYGATQLTMLDDAECDSGYCFL